MAVLSKGGRLMSKCEGCENELEPTVEEYEFAELGYCSSICFHENTVPPKDEIMISLEQGECSGI